jgi:hypothetical protein
MALPTPRAVEAIGEAMQNSIRPTDRRDRMLGSVLVLLVGACSPEAGPTLAASLHTSSTVSTVDVQSITLYLFGQRRTDGNTFGCTDLLQRAFNPRDQTLILIKTDSVIPGVFHSYDLDASAGVVLYVEAYKTPIAGGPVAAAGCSDVVVPSVGRASVVVDMFGVEDLDGDGWIGKFLFGNGQTAPGPDCNDMDPTVHPGAPEGPCEGDKNCDHQLPPCDRQCQSNAECIGRGGCCDLSSFTCYRCPPNGCATSSECQRQGGCCDETSMMCTASSSASRCLCANTADCPFANQCCVSNFATDPLRPGTCATVGTGFGSSACRCQHDAECTALFGATVCCVSPERVCGIPNQVGESCTP